MKNLSRLQKEFASPSSRYRGKTFWAWNGELEEGEFRRQIRVMQRMGFGGFFMHARVGLATPYPSSEYMDLTRACIDEAKRLGLEAWLYDEDRWPSGFAGGLVTREERFRERALVCEKLSQRTYRCVAGDVAVFAASWQGEGLESYRRLEGRAAGRRDEQLLRFRVAIAPTHANYNNASYVDTMNREAIAKFIAVTHARFGREIGEEFGRTLPGIFTDGPCYSHSFPSVFEAEPQHLPWTEALPRVFQQRYGYDILGHLPELVFDTLTEPVSQPRWHYHDCITFSVSSE